MAEQQNLITLLETTLQEIKARNPHFSSRAFAERLGIAPSTLTMVLKGTRSLSEKTARKIADRLALDPSIRATILSKPKPLLDREKQALLKGKLLQSPQQSIVANWHAMAILSLIKTRSFQSNPEWIAKRLAITPREAELAIRQLMQLGLVEKSKNQKLIRGSQSLRTTDGVFDRAIRQSHFQTLNLVSRSMKQDPAHSRDCSWTMLAFDRNRVQEAKEFIRKFQREFSEHFSFDEAAEDAYRLSIQLVPLTKELP